MNECIPPPAIYDSRRYYLHRKLKAIVKIAAYRKLIYVNESVYDTMTEKQIRYFLELQVKFKYSIQYENGVS